EVAVFQGASFFRAVGNGQNLGVTARGLAIRAADPKGEEFPIFREMWIERPAPAMTDHVVIHAILDSESVTGAYHFTIRPGDATIIDTECTLYPRVGLDNIGLGSMQATFFRGPMSPHSEDIRPIVGDSLGLRMLTGRGEWLWRPLANREMLQVSSFV